MLERTALPNPSHPALPNPSRPAPGLHLPRRVGMSPQFVQFALVVMGIALVTFIMYLYVLPNSQINAGPHADCPTAGEKVGTAPSRLRGFAGNCALF